MDFSNPSRSAGNLVESLKDKLNFGSRKAAQEEELEFDDYAYEDEFEDYGEYGFDESYATGAGAYGDTYSESYATRESYRPPRLVSLGDVQNTTSAYGVMAPYDPAEKVVPTNSSVPGYLSHSADTRFSSRATSRMAEPATTTGEEVDSTAASGLGAGYDRPNTRYNDFVSPYQRQNVEKTQVMPSTGSAGLDGLFTSTDSAAQAAAPDRGQSIGGRFSRKVEIFEPKDFEQAVDIVAMLKEGSAVVLNLKYVNAGLSKRVLDFAFGVVAALDAQINYEAPQVFSITQSDKLTLVERDQLRLKRIL